MGNSKSAENFGVSHLEDATNWVFAQNIGYCDVFKNQQTGEELEQYTIPLDGRTSFIQELEKYEYRRTQNQNLVTVRFVQKQESKYLCSGMDFIKVKTERIPYRLANLQNICQVQCYYILQEALIGYKTIHEKLGPVRIDDEMIGFTPNGKVKVWLNQNFAKNSPEEPEIREQGKGELSEAGMVNELVRTIEKHCSGQFHQLLRAGFQKPLTFVDADAFFQDFIDRENIIVPGKVRLNKSGQPQPSSISVQSKVGSAVKQGPMPSLHIPQGDQLSAQLGKAIIQNVEASQVNQQSTLKLAQSTIPLVLDSPPVPVPPASVIAPTLAPLAHSSITQQTITPQTKEIVVDTITTALQMDGSMRRSVSRERKSLGTPKRPPLPPRDNMEASRNLRGSQAGVTTTTTTVTQTQPVFVSQQTVTSTPVTFVQQGPPVVVTTTLRSSRASSSHGEGSTILRTSSRPSSSHGIAPSTIILTQPSTIPVSTVPLTTIHPAPMSTTTFIQPTPLVSTVPIMTGGSIRTTPQVVYNPPPTTTYINPPSTTFINPPSTTFINPPATRFISTPQTAVGSFVLASDSRHTVGLDNSRVPMIQRLDPIRTNFTNPPVIQQHTTFSGSSVSNHGQESYITPQVANLITNLKRELSADKFKGSSVNSEHSSNSNSRNFMPYNYNTTGQSIYTSNTSSAPSYIPAAVPGSIPTTGASYESKYTTNQQYGYGGGGTTGSYTSSYSQMYDASINSQSQVNSSIPINYSGGIRTLQGLRR